MCCGEHPYLWIYINFYSIFCPNNQMYYEFIIIRITENVLYLLQQRTWFHLANHFSLRWTCEDETQLLPGGLTELLLCEPRELLHALYSSAKREPITANLHSVFATRDWEPFGDWLWNKHACKTSITRPSPESKRLHMHYLRVSSFRNLSGVFKRAY